jgi:hypothetical protein
MDVEEALKAISDMLSDALRTLSAPPSAGEKKQAIADVNAKIAVLKSQLGIKARLMPIFNPARAVKRLTELQAQLAAKGPALPPGAGAVASAVRAVAPAEPEILTATFSEFQAMTPETRLQFAQDNGALSHADFSALTPAAKMQHCRNGGQVLADRRRRCTAAASFGNS